MIMSIVDRQNFDGESFVLHANFNRIELESWIEKHRRPLDIRVTTLLAARPLERRVRPRWWRSEEKHERL